MDNILFSSIPSHSPVCWELRFPGVFSFMFARPHDSSKNKPSVNQSPNVMHQNIAPKIIFTYLRYYFYAGHARKIGSKTLHPQKHKNMAEVNGESSSFFGLFSIKTKIAKDWLTALKVLLYVLNSFWLQKLVELRPSKHFGSNEPWDIGDLWQPVLYW